MLGKKRCCCKSDCLPCSPCQIPRKDLTLSWPATSGAAPPFNAAGSTPLVYDGIHTWTTACINSGSGSQRYSFSCGTSGLIFAINDYLTGCMTLLGSDCYSSGGVGGCFNVTVTYACNPFHVVFPTGITFSIDDPDDPPTFCPEVCLECSPCRLPKKDLKLTVSGGAIGNGTYTMTRVPGGPIFAGTAWSVAFSPEFGLTYNISFGCLPGGNLGIFEVASSFGNVPCTVTHIADFTCNPLHVHFQDVPTVCTTGLFSDFTIDDPDDPPTFCPVENCATCLGHPFPLTFTVTDANASFAVTNTGSNTWLGGYTLTRTGVISAVGSSPVGCTCTIGSCSFRVSYGVTCNDSSGVNPAIFSVSRSWRLIYIHPDIFNTADCDTTQPPSYVDDSIPLSQCCSSDSNPSLASAGLTKAPDSCSPFSWSGTLTAFSPLDPAPGAVAITL